MITFLIVYISGYIVSYIGYRFNAIYLDKDKYEDWTVGERTKALLWSILSWLFVFIELIAIIEYKNTTNKNKKAKW